MAIVTFKAIYAAAQELPGLREEVADEIQGFLGSAETNAHETIFLEKAAQPDAFDTLALATLENLLCDGNPSKGAADWFRAAGVAW